MAARLLHRELEQIQRARDVHLVRGHRRELAARRKQGGQVIDAVDLVLGLNVLEQVAVQDGARELARYDTCQRPIECSQIDGDHGNTALIGKPLDQRVADLSSGTGDEDDGLAHGSLPAKGTTSWPHISNQTWCYYFTNPRRTLNGRGSLCECRTGGIIPYESRDFRSPRGGQFHVRVHVSRDVRAW